MATTVKPREAEEVRAFIAWAAAEEEPIELLGAGTKRGWGRPVQAAHSLDLSGLSGVTLYEPEELVLSARAGTPLREIEDLLAAHRQQLAFEPAHLGAFFGGAADGGTIGGVLACNLAGPRRIKAGAARDHFLGATFVNGRGELVKTGGRVVKNVTGYDLCKLLAGSYGTLGALTDVTLKVLPAPERVRTLVVFGLDDATGVRALTAAIGSEHEVSAAAHLPAAVAGDSLVPYVSGAGGAVTALRIEGFPASVNHRTAALGAILREFGPIQEIRGHNSTAFWAELRDARYFARRPEMEVWRLSVPPASGADVVGEIARERAVTAWYDWAGGLIWLGLAPGTGAATELVRGALRGTGGHATLMRAPDAVRAAAAVFEPADYALGQLTERIKAAFDPRGVLNPGRLYPGT
jgi:glycolate oxidase FAD binding subunit